MAQDNGAGLRNGVRKKPRRGAGYPDRTPFFFHRFVRWLIKTCAAMVIGADGCFLCTVVAATEDSARYRYAVRFFNSQLAQLCGWSVDKLDSVRRRCIDEGFLHYERGGNRTPGLYWVLVDDSLGDAPEVGPIGELDSDFKPQSAEHPADDSATEPLESCGETPEESTELTSLPFPDTSPPPPPVVSGEPSKPEPAGDADQWGEVEEGLISSGVSHWRGLLGSFRGAGCSAEHALALIEFWKRHRDRFNSPVGALHHRFENAHPTIPVDEGWPGLQADAKPKRAADSQIELLTARWCRTDKPRRHEIAKLAGVDLAGNDGQGLRELPNEIRKPIVTFLSQLDARQAEKSNEA
ncbi:MAG: hypothetical protein ACKVHE_32775 [Planctomycetales bacterium]|jgi:hypothetical protein